MDVWYILINHEKEPLGNSDKVLVSRDATVDDLKGVIKERRQHNLREVDSSELVIWQCKKKVLSAESDVDELKDDIEAIDFKIKDDAIKLSPGKKVIDLLFDKHDKQEVLLVQVPEVRVQDFVALNRSVAHVRYGDQVIFKVSCDVKGNPAWDTVISLNGYEVREQLPPFIKDVVESPRRAPDGDMAENVLLRCLKTMSEAHAGSNGGTQIVNNLLSNEGNAVPYTSGHFEIFHYIHAFKWTMDQQVKLANGASVADTRLTMHQARYIVLENFQEYWLRQVEGSRCTFGQQLPFPFIVNKISTGDPMSCRYQPQPDIAFDKRNYPRFLGEVDSKDNERDKYRLYAQMACVLSLAFAVGKDAGREDKNIFLMGAFFSIHWRIERLFVYLDGENICFHVKWFEMKNARDLTAFLFEFYNYAKHVQDADTFVDMKEAMKTTTQEIEMKYTKSLFTDKRSKRSAPREDDTDSDAVPGSGAGPSKRERSELIYALENSGFVVEIDDSSDEFEPLDKLPPHVVKARTADGKIIAAKLPHRTTDELSLLQELSSRKSPHNHVIPLLDTVQSSVGPLIILPWATLLSTKSAPFLLRSELKGKSVQLSHELVEGVAFLHRQRIAHLDIKPENLVYCFKSKHLYIIDFDIAMHCDVDEMVEISCGTPGWSAPEIVHDDNKPLRAFMPIRADLWSCGKVLWFFSEISNEKDRDLVHLMNLLLASDPGRRPLLHEVVYEEANFWTSGHLHRALESEACGSKAQRTTPDTKRVRGDASDADEEHLPSKFVRLAKGVGSDARPPFPSASSSPASSQSSMTSSPDSSLDSPYSSTVSGLINNVDGSPSTSGKMNTDSQGTEMWMIDV